MDAQTLYYKICAEEKREDKPFDYVEFNKRDGHIIMNVIYQTDTFIGKENHHTFPHDLDPIIMNEDTFIQLKKLLVARGIRFIERTDQFI